MAKLYKLTKTNGTTKGDMKWSDGVTHKLPIKHNPKLCSSDVIHAYESLEVAVFMRYIHGYDGDVICYEAEGEVVVRDVIKCGVFELTCGKAVHLPKPTIKHSVLFALLCAQRVFASHHIDKAIQYAKWGDYANAAAAARAAYAAAYAAYAAADARASAYAADAAADARAAAYAARAAYAAADAAADAAAYAAADAADTAACTDKTLNLQEIAKQVMEEV